MRLGQQRRLPERPSGQLWVEVKIHRRVVIFFRGPQPKSESRGTAVPDPPLFLLCSRDAQTQMPLASPHNSFIPPFDSIRVDNFTRVEDKSIGFITYLLTHAHSDHLPGLQSEFATTVLCTRDTKTLVLCNETEANRILYDNRSISEIVRTYKHLQANNADYLV